VKIALVNPPWSFEGSDYLGCREPHLPLVLGYARALLAQRGHDARLFDAQLSGVDLPTLVTQLASYRPDATVLTTAPSYLSGGCAPPDLRVPRLTARALRRHTQRLFIVGPHGSSAPGAILAKMDADAVVMGECEAVLPGLLEAAPADYPGIDSIAYPSGGAGYARAGAPIVIQGTQATVDLQSLPPLCWNQLEIAGHRHHHHRFDRAPEGPSAELEASRGCPYACAFCAKDNSRNRYRTRPLQVLLEELDGLLALGVRYVYFIDEIFLPNRALLGALLERPIQFGVQLRMDNWSEELLELLGRAGCVSIEANVESITPDGGSSAHKGRKLSTEQLTQRLLFAKRRVPFVQANLYGVGDDRERLAGWRAQLASHGVWSNQPVPAFPDRGSPEHRLESGQLDDHAGQRAHGHHLRERLGRSDVPERAPQSFAELEA
jgi:B12-binding domain/radical SAM domain protein of rhizo-twelve system